MYHVKTVMAQVLVKTVRKKLVLIVKVQVKSLFVKVLCSLVKPVHTANSTNIGSIFIRSFFYVVFHSFICSVSFFHDSCRKKVQHLPIMSSPKLLIFQAFL